MNHVDINRRRTIGLLSAVLVGVAVLARPSVDLAGPLTRPGVSRGDETSPSGTEETDADCGSISGVVRFQGASPRADRIRVTRDHEACGTRKRQETFIISPENKGLKNVLITVQGLTGPRAHRPHTSVTVEQNGCVYVPHFQVAVLGKNGIEMVVENKDGILHNIHAYLGTETLFNIAQPSFVQELKKKLTKPGVVSLKCDVHNWMNAYVVLIDDTPFYNVTAEQGQFVIEDVPPGNYTLRAWHEALGQMEKPVEVNAGQATKIDFVIKPKKKRGD